MVFALCVTAAQASERWLEVRSPHFRVVTDAGEKDGRAVAAGFEDLRGLLGSLGNLRVDPPAPIVIVATSDESGLRAFLPWYWERRAGTRPAGVFLPGVDKHYVLLRLDVPQERRNLAVYHEYLHLVVKLNYSGLPLWLNEGLAEFFATTIVEEHKVRYGLVSPERLAMLRARAPLPLADLFAVDTGSREYNEENRASVFYAQSALLTHYFLIGDDGRHAGKLKEYLRLLSEGASAEQAQARAFGDPKELQKAFFDYVRRFQFLLLESPRPASDDDKTVRVLGEAELLALRGDVLARRGRVAEARRLLLRARELDAGLAIAAQVLGTLEAEAGRFADARRHLDDALRLAPDDFASHYLWARARPATDGEGDSAATEAALRRALQLNTSFAPAHALLATGLRRRGQLEQAFASLRAACQLEPDNVAYWVQRADLLRGLQRPEVADAIEAQLARSASSDTVRLRALASYFRSQKRFEDLEKLLHRAAELNPRNSQAPLMLGDHFREQGRGDEAEAEFRRALVAQPDNPVILNRIAYHNADRGAKLPESLNLIDRALKLLPEEAALLDTKGWVLFRMGRLDEAERYLRRALDRDDDPEIVEHLGDVLERRSERPAAEAMWRQALEHPGATREQQQRLRRKLALPDPSPAPPVTKAVPHARRPAMA
jgi:tetratricopeptide (TPR) repeat protein